MAVYSKEYTFDVTGGLTTNLVLPAPMRGSLDRLIVSQVGGTAVDFDFSLFNRRGASVVDNDLNTLSGKVTTVANSSSKCLVTTDAAHNLKVGDQVAIKSTDQTAYNVLHTVTVIPTSTTFVSNINYGSAGTGGYWQQLTDPPLGSPDAYRILPHTLVSSGSNYAGYGLSREYENRDVQTVTARRRASALYLELSTAGSLAKRFEIAITVVPNITD